MRAVFLDRDGVINRAIVKAGKPYPPSTVEELEILEDVPEALRSLQSAGFWLIGVTNQPDVARGTQRQEVVEAINSVLLSSLPLTEIRVCYHDDADHCECRKPNPGLLRLAAQAYDIKLPESFMIGDRWKDIEAGHRAGCRTILIDQGYDEQWKGVAPDYRVASLAEAASCILQERSLKE